MSSRRATRASAQRAPDTPTFGRADSTVSNPLVLFPAANGYRRRLYEGGAISVYAARRLRRFASGDDGVNAAQRHEADHGGLHECDPIARDRGGRPPPLAEHS